MQLGGPSYCGGELGALRLRLSQLAARPRAVFLPGPQGKPEADAL